MAEAARLYAEGRTLTAREVLERAIPSLPSADARAEALDLVLDICTRTEAVDCVRRNLQPFLDARGASLSPQPLLKAEQARRASYFLDYARVLQDPPSAQGPILEAEAWRHEFPQDVPLYLQRQALAADISLKVGAPADAVRYVDKTLSLIASLKDPARDRSAVAIALSEAIAVLLDVGQTERAWGVYRAGRPLIAATLPPRSFEAALFALRSAQLLQAVGDMAAATRDADQAAAGFDALELEPQVREGYLAQALTLKVALAALQGDRAGAAEALARHPYAELYRTPGRRAAGYDETAYLAARAFAGAGKPDPAVAAALAAPAPDADDPHLGPTIALYRQAGLALTAPLLAERQAALKQLAARAIRNAAQPPTVFGAWYRPGAIDRAILALALASGDLPAADPDTTFALFQLAQRAGPSFDADALALLSDANDPLARRSVHQALRLLARRDRLERERIAAVAARAQGPTNGEAGHDVAVRLDLRDAADRIDEAQAALRQRGRPMSLANLVPLQRFQALLRPDEAALVVAPSVGGLAYMCVRHDGVVQARRAFDPQQTQLDARLLQNALTATYAPDEALDRQFPAAAAVRLYDVFVRPFEPCLKPGDHLVWLSPMASLGLPLAALLREAPPPAEGGGFDLARADWLVRRYAVSYAGSAAVVAAARSSALPAPAFDFLGVGEPILDAGASPSRPRAAEIAALPPLPETAGELAASAKPFQRTRLLTGRSATEPNFRAELIGQYRYLAFATHGLMREDVEGLDEPALVLTASAADEGLLTASEIADLNLAARFVALSACNTANYDQTQASQDLPALASAFAVAGAPATLATLWPVNSQTGAAITPAVFAELGRDGVASPARALAAAQRAFLAAPPGKAFLHPRFWAPFVVLGDGGNPVAETNGANIRAVESLGAPDGEVLGLRRTPEGLAAAYIGEAGATGTHAAGVRLAAADGRELWRRESNTVGASRILTWLGGRLAVGGYSAPADNLVSPAMRVFEPTGRPVASWSGAGLSDRDTVLLDALDLGDGRLALLIGEPRMRSPPTDRPPLVRLLTIDAAMHPKTLTEIAAPRGWSVAEGALALVGGELLVSFSDAYAPAPPAPDASDDFAPAPCLTAPRTRLEIRDIRTGALKRSRDLSGVAVSAAAVQAGQIVIAGAEAASCLEARAFVARLDAALSPQPVFDDTSLGRSQIRALQALADGRLIAVGNKEAMYDAHVGSAADRAASRSESGLVVMIDAHRPAAPLLIDSGRDVFLSAVAPDGGGGVVAGGSVGGGAALVHLTLPPAGR